MYNYYLGKEFRWFVGTVENIQDPMKIGRIQVRAHGIHSEDKNLVPTSSLPWAQIIVSPINSNQGSQSDFPSGPEINSQVLGFFLDGSNCQYPMIFGSFLSIADAESLLSFSQTAASNRASNIDKNTLFTEPHSYSPQYPENKIRNTHTLLTEVDDTPGSERFLNQHKSGTFAEIGPDGSYVTKVVGSNYTIVIKDNDVHTKGNENVQVDGNETKLVKGNKSETVNGNETDLIEGNLNYTVSETATLLIGGLSIAISGGIASIKGKMQIGINGDCDISSTGNVNVSGAETLSVTSSGPIVISGKPVTINGLIHTQVF